MIKTGRKYEVTMKNIKRLLTGIGVAALGFSLVSGFQMVNVKADSKETIAILGAIIPLEDTL